MGYSRFFLIGLGLLATACGGSGSGTTADHLRSFTEPKSAFVVNPAAMETNVKSLSSDEMTTIMKCHEPSSRDRLRRDRYSVAYNQVSRTQNHFDLPMIVTSEVHGYSTENFEKVSTQSYELINVVADGKSLLRQGGYAYKDTCSRTSGCDPKKRVFIKGNPRSMLVSIDGIQDLYSELTESIANPPNCQAVSDPEGPQPKQTIQEGWVTIGSVEHEAVLLRTIEDILLVCSGVEVATNGQRIRTRVVLKDTIPQLDSHLAEFGCSRTQIFESELESFGGEVFSASSVDVFDINIQGYIQPLEEWKSAVGSYEKTKTELQNALDIAQVRYNQANSEHAKALADRQRLDQRLKTARIDYQEAKNRFDQVNDPSNTEATTLEKEEARERLEELAQLVGQLEAAYQSAVESERLAREAKYAAEEHLLRARQAYQNHIDQGPPTPGA